MMLHRSRLAHLALLAAAAVLFSLSAAPAGAQTVSCTGVPAWNASAIYNPGARIVYQGQLYQANVPIWNTPPNYCPACGWYTLLGTCGTGSNNPPTVSITAPAGGSTFTPGSNITISASAADGDGSVTQVQFRQGTTSLGVDTSAPYSVTWANVPAGSYSLTAVATDNGGATTTSSAVSITVAGGGCSTLPSVPGGLTSPSQTTTGVNLAWSASSPGSNCTVQYRVFRDGTQVAQVAGTTAAIGGLQPATTYSFRVAAINQFGSSAQGPALSVRTAGTTGGCTAPQYVAGTPYSAGQQVQNVGQLYRCNIAGWCSSSAAWAYAPGTGMHWQDAWSHVGACTGGGSPPTVSLTAPANGASFACGASVTVSASASDSDGSVTRVEFFDNGLKIGEDTSAPYSASWSAGVGGSHQLTAKATDNANNTTTSAARTVTVTGCGTGSLPARVLVGYWHNFENGSGFIKLRDVSTDWDVVNLAFGEPVPGSTSRIAFTPYSGTSEAEIRSDVQVLHGRGKKVLLSVGGANGHVELRNSTERQQFVDSVTSIIQSYGLDGLDVDFEGQSVHLNPGDSDFTSPTTPVIVNLISALREIRSRVGSSFILTMAPETFFVQVGYQFYGGASGGDSRTGAYLPVIHGVRDILTLLHVQDYNSGPVTALDNRFYNMGNADFHVAMTEMLMTGFPVANTGRFFPGLRPDQVAIGLPANGNAGNGFTPVAEVQRALNYLIRGQSFGGQYVLRNPSGYRGLRGLMAWSVNWDRFAGFDFSRNHRAYLNALPTP